MATSLTPELPPPLPSEPRIALIVAVANNGVIGDNNSLPWHLPEDLRHFRKLTMGKPVIMGRKTWESLGKPLPGRRNIVISRETAYAAEGADVCASLEAALALAAELARAACVDEIMVIGGEAIYRAALPQVQRIYLTQVDLSPLGDAVFPRLNPDEWQQLQCETLSSAPVAAQVKVFERHLKV